MNRSIILPALVTAFVALSPAGVALADNPHLDSNDAYIDEIVIGRLSRPDAAIVLGGTASDDIGALHTQPGP